MFVFVFCQIQTFALDPPPTQDSSHHHNHYIFRSSLVGNPRIPKKNFITVTRWGVDPTFSAFFLNFQSCSIGSDSEISAAVQAALPSWRRLTFAIFQDNTLMTYLLMSQATDGGRIQLYNRGLTVRKLAPLPYQSTGLQTNPKPLAKHHGS